VRDVTTEIEAEIERRVRKSRPWCPDNKPHPKQDRFVHLTCPEALYGGAGGGGKSTALLKCCAKYVTQPKFSALIVRRTHKELVKSGALMDRAHLWWDRTEAVWSAGNKCWTFPSGATIEFGYFDHWTDRNQYMSAQWNLVCFDELTQFPEDHYTFLFTRIRRDPDSAIPSMMRAATNPGNIGHEWVMRRFMAEENPDRVFIQANFRDNPAIDHEDYERNLMLSDVITRRQMMGEWVHDGVGLVYRECTAKNVITEAPSHLDYYVCGLDFGQVDDNAVVILGWNEHDTKIYVVEAFRRKAIVSELSDEVKELERKYHFHKIVGDIGGQGKAFSEEMRKRHHIPVEGAEKSNKLGYIRLLNDDFARGRVLVVKPTCQELLDEYKELYWDKTGEKEIASADNHASDAMLYAWRASCAYAESPEEEAIPGGVIDVQRKAEAAGRRQWESMPKEDQEIWDKQGVGSSEKNPWWQEGF
jgi:PBSX family phage terminase large subunit